jgi:hypothetical protein
MQPGNTYVNAHEHIVELEFESVFASPRQQRRTYLLVTNGELALRLFVGFRESLELLDRLRLGHMHTELHVRLGVLVAGLQAVSQGFGDQRMIYHT